MSSLDVAVSAIKRWHSLCVHDSHREELRVMRTPVEAALCFRSVCTSHRRAHHMLAYSGRGDRVALAKELDAARYVAINALCVLPEALDHLCFAVSR